MQELVDSFSIDRINRAECRIDASRLDWLQKQHCAKAEPLDPSIFHRALVEHAAARQGCEWLDDRVNDASYLRRVLQVCAMRATTVPDFLFASAFFFRVPAEGDYLAAAPKDLAPHTLLCFLSALGDALAKEESTETAAVKAALDQTCPEIPYKSRAAMLRVALTGQSIGPPIADVATLLGRQQTLLRISRCRHALGKECH